MFGLTKTFEIVNRVIKFISILMMNDVIGRNWPMDLFPDQSMKHLIPNPKIATPHDEFFAFKVFHFIPLLSCAYNDIGMTNIMENISQVQVYQ
jgi:hypothetical protein